MGLPAVVKTWQHSINNVLVDTGTLLTDNQNLLFKLKQVLATFGTLPWTVAQSCNGAGGGGSFNLDGTVDKWASAASLIWATDGSNHSWVVLQQTGVGANFQICIDLASGSPGSATISFSPNALFGSSAVGTAIAAPRATDEIFLIGTSHAAPAAWNSSMGSAYSAVLHVQQSTDGQCTRAWIDVANVTTIFILFDKPGNSVTGSPGWVNPCIGLWTIAAPTIASLCVVATPLVKGRANGVTMTLFMTSEGYSTASFPLGQRQVAPSDLTAEFLLCPIGLASETVSAKGRHGTVQDLWWTSTAINNHDSFPAADVTRTFIIVGNLVLPWNGSIPKLA